MIKVKSICLKVITVLILSPILSITANAQDEQTAPRLFIGGGALSENMYLEFAKLAGPDAKLVVIPTASSREPELEKIKKRWLDRGIKDVSILHTRDRAISMAADFSVPLKTATVVWISGGSQQRIADAYLDTPVEKELFQLIQRGGLIGGSSAGAAIQTKVMISGGKNPPEITTGFDLLPGAILDQHFLKRSRLGRLIQAVEMHPNLIGLGIEEDTAILITGKEAKVLGASYVLRFEIVEGKMKIDAFEEGEIIAILKK